MMTRPNSSKLNGGISKVPLQLICSGSQLHSVLLLMLSEILDVFSSLLGFFMSQSGQAKRSVVIQNFVCRFLDDQLAIWIQALPEIRILVNVYQALFQEELTGSISSEIYVQLLHLKAKLVHIHYRQ